MRRGLDELFEAVEELVEVVEGLVIALVALLRLRQATSAVLNIQGDPMASTAVLTFTDSSGNPTAPPKGDGSGLVVTFESDNAAVSIGIAVATGDTATAPITGTEAFMLSATVANTSGAPLLDDDGSTPFIQPQPISVAAGVAQAVTAVLSTE